MEETTMTRYYELEQLCVACGSPAEDILCFACESQKTEAKCPKCDQPVKESTQREIYECVCGTLFVKE